MTEFRLKVVKLNRFVLSIIILSTSLPLFILLASKLELIFLKIIIPLSILSSLLLLLYYFSFGLLNIVVIDKVLHFKWRQKPIFNFKDSELKIKDITTIIVEQGIYLTKIETKNSKIELGVLKSDYFKLDQNDSLKLLSFFKIRNSH